MGVEWCGMECTRGGGFEDGFVEAGLGVQIFGGGGDDIEDKEGDGLR